MATLSRGCKPRIHGWLKLKYCYQMQYRYSHFLIRYFTEFRKLKVYNKIYVVYREYFMESAGVRYLRTNCWKTLWVKLFSLKMYEAALQAAIKGGNFGAKLTHPCGFWLDVSFFSHVKKHLWRFWLDVSCFSRVKTIVRSSDWLELICVRKFTT